MKKRILITGANGMLGGTLVWLFQKEYEVYATGTTEKGLDIFKNYKAFDLKSNSYAELIRWSDPDVVIHCAAMTNGNHCEQNPMEAFEVNGLSLKRFADSFTRKTKLIYISTDAVFPSSLHKASEKNCTDPESIYGKTKELGEFFLKNSTLDFTIVRTTIVGLNFNPSKVGFVEWIINSAKNREKISLFDDVLFNPISTWDLAEQLENIFCSDIFSGAILHIAGKEPCTKYEFGIGLLKELGIPVEHVAKGSIKDMKGRAKRSTDQSLDCSKYESQADINLPDLKKTIEVIKENYKYYEKH